MSTNVSARTHTHTHTHTCTHAYIYIYVSPPQKLLGYSLVPKW